MVNLQSELHRVSKTGTARVEVSSKLGEEKNGKR